MGNKKLFLLILIFFFLFQAVPVLAMEINWPEIPGTLPPQEISTKPNDEQLPLLAKYITRFAYIIAIAVVITIIIYSGLSYIISWGSPIVKLTARKRIQQSLLGLLIIVCSYLLLSTINPQLLKFKAEKPEEKPRLGVTLPQPENEITFYQVTAGSNIEQVLNELNETKAKAELEEKTIFALNELDPGRKEIHEGEKPFLRTYGIVSEMVTILEEITKKTEKCKCGETEYEIEWDGLKGKCTTKDSNECSEICGQCGCEEGVLDEIKKLRNKFASSTAQLYAQRPIFSNEQISKIEDTLSLNVGNYLASTFSGVTFQESFMRLKESLEAQGYKVNLERPKQLPENKIITMSPPALDPFSFFALKSGPSDLVNQGMAEENQEQFKESQRMSLFSVLTQLSLEEIEAMISECLVSAFNREEIGFNVRGLAELIQKSLQRGLADYVTTNVEGKSGEMSNNFIKGFSQDVKERVETESSNREEKCLTDCGSLTGSELTKCQTSCRQSIPPHWLSDSVSKFFTQNIKDKLPEEIRKTLDEKLREAIFSASTNEFIDTDIVNLLDNVMEGALTKTLEEQIPFIQENLQKKVPQVISELGLDLVLSPLEEIDVFLHNNLKNFKKRLDREIANLVESLVAELTKPVENLIGGYKARHPELYQENADRDDCEISEYEGWYWNGNQCEKVSLDKINTWENWQSFSREYLSNFYGNSEDWEGYCQAAGFCYNRKIPDEGPAKPVCEKCSSDYWVNLNDLKLSPDQLLRGLVDFAESFVMALAETATHTLTQYAIVWVEDEIIAPLEPYLTQLADFQKNLHEILNASVKDLLPPQLVSYLTSSIEQIIAKLCNEGAVEIYSETITVDPGLREKACNLNKELHKNLADKLAETCDINKESLGCQISNALSDTVLNNLRKALCPDSNKTNKQCILDFLKKTPAQLIFPSLGNQINDIIIGTPKDIICSNLLAQTLDNSCKRVQDKKIGILPYHDENSQQWKDLSDGEKAYCYFYWYGCNNPLENWNTGIGEIVEYFVVQFCGEVEKECGTDYKSCPNSEWQKKADFCEKIKEDTIAFTLFELGIRENYGYLNSSNSKEEIEAYQWFLVLFGNKVLNSLDQFAEERDLQEYWRSGPRTEALNASDLNDLPVYKSNPGDFAKSFVSWFNGRGATLGQIITSYQLGIMKEFRGDSYRQENFLGKTIRGFLEEGFCYKVNEDFLRDYPDWTIEKIKARLDTGGSRYSIEYLTRPTDSKALEELIKTNDVPENRKIPYISCWTAGQSPEHIFGLDKHLVRYIHPFGYQIMFDLIKDKLSNEERPIFLNQLLDLLYSRPSTILKQLAGKLRAEGKIEQAEKAEASYNFMTRKIYTYIPLNNTIARMIFGNYLDRRASWETWNKIRETLLKTPLQIIKENISNKPLIETKYTETSLMDLLAGEYPFLKERYVDLLGEKLGITEPIFNFYNDDYKEFENSVNEGVKNAKSTIQKTFEEAPKTGLNWISQTLARTVGLDFGGKISDQVAGSGVCRDVSDSSQCRENETYKEEQCCDVGQSLVCIPQSRPIDSSCKVEEGEISSPDKTTCYYPNCRSCRVVKEEKNCKDNEYYESVYHSGIEKEIKLCCTNRTEKEEEGENFCCVNVMKCVTDKLTSHLRGSMVDIMKGTVPLNNIISDSVRKSFENN